MTRRALLVYVGLLANVLAFFHKPLFSANYMFPWDFRYVQLPLISFLADQLRQGRVQLWDPYSYCGDPIFANIQASFFHPLVFLAAFLSAHISLDRLPLFLEWMVALQMWIGGVTVYHLFRRSGACAPAAWAGAIVFETGGYFAAQTEHIGTIMAVAWMPLSWLSVLRLRHNPSWGWIAALSAALGMSVLGGFPQATLAVFGSTMVLSIVLVLHKLSRPRLVLLTLAGCFLGVCLAGIQYIPTAQVTQYSVAKYRAEWLGTGGGVYWQSFVSLVLPNHYHLFDVSQFNGPGDLTFLYLYGSIAGLCLAIYCVIRRRDRYVSVLAVMALLGAFWMLGDKTYVWRLLYPLLPVAVRIGIHPEYTFCNFTLPFAGLVALGLDHLPIRDVLRWAIGMIIALDLFLVGSGRPMNCTLVPEKNRELASKALDESPELFSAVRNFVNRDFPPARIDTMDTSIAWVEAAPLTRVPTSSGASPLALENTIQLRMMVLLREGDRWGSYYPVENPDSPVLDIMNVKYLLVSPRAAGRLNNLPRYRRVASLAGTELFENLSVMPRYFLVHSARRASTDESKRLILNREVDLHRTALIDGDVSLPSVQPDAAAERIEPLRYEPDSLELDVVSSQTSLLVLSEAFYPGWRAWVDDRPTPIFRTDIAYRGLVVPGGKHRVRMEFQPGIFLVSRIVSAVAIAIVACMACFRRRRIFTDPVATLG